MVKSVASVSDNSAQKSVLWTKDYILLILVSTAISTNMFMINTILPIYLVGVGTALTLTGVIVGIFFILSLLVRPIAGYSADRLDKKILLLISSIVLGFCVVGYALSDNTVFILVCRVFHGLAFGISGTAAAALASDIIPKDRMGEGIGYFGIGMVIATALGPAIGLAAVSFFGYPVTFVLAGLIVFIGALLLILVKPPKHAQSVEKINVRFSLSSFIAKKAWFYVLLSVFISISIAMINTFLILSANQKNIKDISIYFIICAVFLFLARPLTGKILDKHNFAVLLYPSFAVILVAMVLHGLATTIWMLLIAGMLRSLAQGCIMPAFQVMCIRKAGLNCNGVANSTYFMGLDIAVGIGPMIGGVIATAFGYSATFYFAAILSFVGIVLFFIYDRHEKYLSLEAIDNT